MKVVFRFPGSYKDHLIEGTPQQIEPFLETVTACRAVAERYVKKSDSYVYTYESNEPENLRPRLLIGPKATPVLTMEQYEALTQDEVPE
jgi:hypothetical protein